MAEEEAERKYLEYNWAESTAWQTWYTNLFPTPQASQIDGFKRKWFKKNVDPQLRLVPISSEAPSTQAPSTSSTTAASPTASPTLSTIEKTWNPIAASMLVCAMILSVLAILPTSIGNRFRNASLILYLCGFIASVIASYGLPKLNADYWQLIMHHDGLQNVLTVVTCYSINLSFAMISPFIGGLLLTVALIPRIPYTVRIISSIPMLQTGLNQIRDKTPRLQQIKSDLELYAGLSSVVLGLFGRVNFISVVLFWNALRTKYSLNSYTRESFRRLHLNLASFFSRPGMPGIFNTIYSKIAAFCMRCANP